MRLINDFQKRDLFKITCEVAKIREANNWSQRELSKYSKVHCNTIARAEVGKVHYSLPSLLKICRAFKIQLSELIQRAGL